jgi:putative ABC transport system permease protein
VRTLRNVFRRKARAFLTIFGIAIGVFALVVMGSMAEKITLLVDGGMKYYVGKVIVSPKGAMAGLSLSPLSTNKVKDLESMPGVARASSQIGMTLDEEMSMVNFGPPASISASDGREKGFETFVVTYSAGRELLPSEHGAVTVGTDIVKKLNAQVGSTVKIRDKKFVVVGIMDKTLTAPDNAVYMNLPDAQELYKKSLPGAVRSSLNEKTLATSIVVYPKKGVEAENLAKMINHGVLKDDLTAMGPNAFRDQIQSSLSTFTSMIFGIALISLLVGGLSVINTMTMAVAERTREIGIRKAIGASSGAVMRQFVAEAAVIGLIGGLAGLFFGWLVVFLANAAGEASGTVIFLLTDRLAIGSVLFAIGLGVVSGLYPAWHASGLNPVEALRYE